jgi:cyclopropane fatty-acyl-phospholipid synthase-like methyltransferase
LSKFVFQDYRHITGQFDKIASIEMLEAVGDEYLEVWFAKCHEVLKPDGLLAFQAITTPDCRHKSCARASIGFKSTSSPAPCCSA